MKKVSVDFIKSLNPCTDPYQYDSEWEGTAADILNRKDVPVLERIWLAAHPEISSMQVHYDFMVYVNSSLPNNRNFELSDLEDFINTGNEKSLKRHLQYFNRIFRGLINQPADVAMRLSSYAASINGKNGASKSEKLKIREMTLSEFLSELMRLNKREP